MKQTFGKKRIVFCLLAIVAVGIAAAAVFLFKSRGRFFLFERSVVDRTEPEEGDLSPVKLEFRLVHSDSDMEVTKYMAYLAQGGDPDEYPDGPSPLDAEFLPEERHDENGNPTVEYTLVNTAVLMDGSSIKDSYVTKDMFDQNEIIIVFNEEGAAQFGEITGANVGRRLAIVIDGQLYSAPTLLTRIDDGTARITGSFTLEEARWISSSLRRSMHGKSR